jgi:hypothetical protein
VEGGRGMRGSGWKLKRSSRSTTNGNGRTRLHVDDDVARVKAERLELGIAQIGM